MLIRRRQSITHQQGPPPVTIGGLSTAYTSLAAQQVECISTEASMVYQHTSRYLSEIGYTYAEAPVSGEEGGQMTSQDNGPTDDLFSPTTDLDVHSHARSFGPAVDVAGVDRAVWTQTRHQADYGQSSVYSEHHSWMNGAPYAANNPRTKISHSISGQTGSGQGYYPQEENARDTEDIEIGDLGVLEDRMAVDSCSEWMLNWPAEVPGGRRSCDLQQDMEQVNTQAFNPGHVLYEQQAPFSSFATASDPADSNAISPWSGFNLRTDLDRQALMSMMHHTSLQGEAISPDGSGDTGNVLSRIHENDMISDQFDADCMGQDMIAVSRDEAERRSNGAAYQEYANDQGCVGRPCSHSTPEFTTRYVGLSAENCASSILFDRKYCDTNSPFSSAATPACPSSHQDSLETLRCPRYGCNAVFRGRHSKGNLGRHRRLKHEEGGPKSYTCVDPLCPRAFDRKDARLKHQRRHHPHLETLPAIRRSLRAMEDDSTNWSSMPSSE